MAYNQKPHPFTFGIIFFLTLCASLWDYRLYGLRPFDLVFLLPFIGFVFFTPYLSMHWHRYKAPVYWLFLCFGIYGYLTYEHQSSLAFIFLLSLFQGIDFQKYYSAILKACIYVLTFLVAVGLFHLFFYQITGHTIDFHIFFDSHQRLYLEYPRLFRTASLFMEPHNFAVACMILILVTLPLPQARLIHLLACASMILSLSLWAVISGFFSAAMVMIWHFQSLTLFIKHYILFIVLTLCAIFLVFSLTSQQYYVFSVMGGRILGIFHDTSYEERFSHSKSHVPLQAPQENPSASSQEVPQTAQQSHALLSSLFGKGISTYPFLQDLPLNGFAFLFHTMGFIGFLILLYYLQRYWRSTQSMHWRQKLCVILSCFLLLTTYPLITYVFFWLFLKLIPKVGTVEQ